MHRQERQQLRYPSEHVVRFASNVDGYYAVDIGCGAGRHAVVLEECGFKVSACDAASAAVKSTASRLKLGKVVQAAMTDLPYPDDTFDVAVAYGVFYYGSRSEHRQAVVEMRRVLKPGGSGFVCVRSDRDWRFDADMAGQLEEGMTIDFVTETELDSVYGVFSDFTYERSEWTTDRRARLNSDWLITVQR